jgi:hypothetical protein
MKRPPAPKNVEQLAEVLRRSQLFSEDEIQSILDRWERDAGDTADFARFARWLVARGYLNDHQANQLFPSNAAPIMQAVIVAPVANPRPERSATPTATAARPQTPAPPLQPSIDVELVDANMATLPLTVAAPPPDVDVEPAAAEPVVLPEPPRAPAAAEITVELVALTEKPAVTDSRPVEKTSTAGLLDWTNVSLYLFLGALGLLVVEFAGWVLAHLVAWLTR